MPIDMATYLKQRKDEQQKLNEARQKAEETPNKNNGYQFGKILGTVTDVIGDIGYGFVKGVEGMSDALLGIAANVFNSDELAEAVKENQTEELFGGIDKKMSGNSFLNNDSNAANIVHQVGSGVGMMLPSIAITAMTKGAVGKEGIATAAGMIAFGAGAGGTSMEEALNEGATKEKALAYGALSGAKEAAIEYVSGKIGGSNMITKAGRDNVFKSGLKSAAKSFVEEGTEEVVGDFIDTQLKRAIYDADAKSPEFKDYLDSFIVGGLTAMAMGGGRKAVDVAQYGTKGSQINSIFQEQYESDIEEYELETKGKITEEKKAQYAKNRENRRNKISDLLLKMKEDASNSKRGENIYKRTVISSADAYNEIVKTNPVSQRIIQDIVNKTNAENGTNISIREINSGNISTINDSILNQLKLDGMVDENGNISESVKAFNDSDNTTVYINTDSKAFEGNLSIYNTVSHELSHNMSEFDKAQLKKSIYEGVLNGDSFLKLTKNAYNVYSYTRIDGKNLYKYYAQLYKNQLKGKIYKERLAYIQEEVMADYLGSKILGAKDFASLMSGKNEIINKAFKALSSNNDLVNSIKNRTKAETKTSTKSETKSEQQSLDLDSKSNKNGAVVKNKGKIKELENIKNEIESNKSLKYSIASTDTPCVRAETIKGEGENKQTTIVYKTTLEMTEDYLYEKYISMGLSETYARNRAKARTKMFEPILEIAKEMASKYTMFDKYNKVIPYYKPNGELALSCVVNNGEYLLNIDFTTICKKREMFSRFLDDFINSGRNMGNGLTVANIEQLNILLKQYGFENACEICFVDSRRKNINNWADNFLNLWNKMIDEFGVQTTDFYETNKDSLKNVDTIYGFLSAPDVLNIDNMLSYDENALKLADEEFAEKKKDGGKANTYDRMREMLVKTPEQVVKLTRNDLLSVERMAIIKTKYPALFSVLKTSYGSNSPKTLLPSAPYASDILTNSEFKKILLKDKTLEKFTKTIGGVRLQSFSDFQITKFVDYCQMILDMEATEAVAHTYTKELSLVELFGKTGIKMNMSLITKEGNAYEYMKNKFIKDGMSEKEAEKRAKDYIGLDVDKDGNFTYSFATESVDFNKAIELQENPEFKGNVGTILVGISDEQIRMALRDNRIKMIIPYHSSGLPIHTRIMNSMGLFTDYTSYQNTKKNGSKMSNDPFMDIFYKSYQENKGNFRKATNDYLKYCDEHGLEPRFSQFRNEQNYYKLLIDFTSDGGSGKYVQQSPVKLKMSNNYAEVVDRECALYEKQYKQYEEHKEEIMNKFEKIIQMNLEENDLEAIKNIKNKQKNGIELSDEEKEIYGEKHERIYESYNSKQDAIKYSIDEDVEEDIFDDDIFEDDDLLLAEMEDEMSDYEYDERKEEYRARLAEKRERREQWDELPEYRKREQSFKKSFHKDYDKLVKKMNDRLSESFKERYKNTVLRYENGYLIPMFHGTPNVEMFEFDPDRIGQNGWVRGYGYYFCDSFDGAEKYSVGYDYENQVDKDGKVLIGFLNITNPASDKRKTITKEQFFDFANKLGIKDDDLNYKTIHWRSDNLEEIYKSNYNDADLLNALIIERNYISFDDTDEAKQKFKKYDFDKYADAIKETFGFDGYVYHRAEGTIAVALKSNQFKAQDNLNPTDSPDIRYSVDESNNELSTELKDYTIEDKVNKIKEKVRTVAPKQNRSFSEWSDDVKQKIEDVVTYKDDLIESFEVQFTDSMAGLEKLTDKYVSELPEIKNISDSKARKEAELKLQRIYRAKINTYRNTEAAANDFIKKELYDKIQKEISEKGVAYQNEFETFLALRTHVKRVEVYENYESYKEILEKELKNKSINRAQYNKLNEMLKEEYGDAEAHPVFGDLTAKEAREMLSSMEKSHPEFVGYASKVYSYLDTLQQMRLSSGIINKTQAKFMRDYYSENGENWYVPTYRADSNNANGAIFARNSTIGVNKGIKAAKGGNSDIQSIFVSIAQQTMGVHKQVEMNNLFSWAKEHTPEGTFVEADTETQTRKDIDGDIKSKNPNEVYFYVDGEKITYKVPANVAAAFNSMRNTRSDWENNVLTKGMEKSVSALKKLTTELNPFFAIRNLFRDASDALIYTKYSTNLLKRYNKALKEIRGKGKYFDLYKSMGGDNMSFFDHDYGINLVEKKGLAGKIANLNETIELLPRLSEFMESLDHSVQEWNLSHEDKITIDDVMNSKASQTEFLEMKELAMYDANEVTVNFGRSGTVTRKLNRYVMPYLNASVQGFAKTLGTFVHPKSMRAWSGAMIKVVLAALPAIVFNEIMLGDDDDYEELDDSIKDSYYLIPVGNHKFVRIPRGRVEAIVGAAAQRLIRAQKNNQSLDEAFDGYFTNTIKNVTPIENVSRTILSPITDVKTNSTWYGGAIENSSMQKLPVNERFDENTSEIAKWLSNATGNKMSPKKWNYLLDQYSGVIGDVVLPLTSSNKSKLISNTGFVSSSTANNNYTNKYYKAYDELQQANNSNKSTAFDKAKLKYFNKMNNKVIELNKARKNTSDKDEQEAIKLLTIQTQRSTLEGLDEFSKTLDKYSQFLEIDELYDEYYREATRECFGAEIALKDYNSKVYEKATTFNKLGIDWETFYNIYFDSKDFEPDYDINGNVINGSKKAKVTKYVKSLKLNATQKYMVMGLLGYKNVNGKAQVRSALIRAGYTDKELSEMLKMCGYDD